MKSADLLHPSARTIGTFPAEGRTAGPPSELSRSFNMAVRESFLALLTLLFLFCAENAIYAQVLTPPYFNLAQGREIKATSTCGEPNPEVYCRLTGATGEKEDADTSRDIIRGQLCDYCDDRFVEKTHMPQFAIDGSERWWQSPPLSRGMEFNEVNLTINLGQVGINLLTIYAPSPIVVPQITSRRGSSVDYFNPFTDCGAVLTVTLGVVGKDYLPKSGIFFAI